MRADASVFPLPRVILITDFLVLAIAYLIPAISHLLPFPLYMADPMRILVLSGYLITRSRTNGFILALTLPFFSTILSGHPFFFKAILISGELVLNIWLFSTLLSGTHWKASLVFFTSIVISKVFYYILKYLFLSFSLIEGDLFSTGIVIQLVIVMAISIGFSFLPGVRSIRSGS
jgi:hypothetical protein